MKNRMLYERCWLCKGTLKTTAPALVDGKDYSGPLAVGSACPGCEGSKTPGWMEVGVTGGQLEKLAKANESLATENAELRARVRALEEGLRPFAENRFAHLTPDDHVAFGGPMVTVGDYRRAVKLLKVATPETNNSSSPPG